MRTLYKQNSLFISLCLCTALAQSAVPSVSDLKTYLLAPSSLTEQDFTEYDRNKDGKIDVADLVYLLSKDGVIEPVFKTGSYTGVFQSNSVIAENSEGSNETLPLEIIIDSLSPASGKLDNSEDNFSLYFPSGSFPLEGLSINDQNISFSISVNSLVPMISDKPITRTLVFEAELAAADKSTVIAGTYTETISGFEDVQGTSLNVVRTGNFVLFQE